ncbi:hypothetical protein [Pseudactinotalea sp. Z1748]|uniref:hypothetical protein n=1 Tax=Pseudactinotalea sp. Z1748 TaxID=3413027 RepID=UPI003C79B5EA
MSDNQPRARRGQPTGGQWVASARQASGISLGATGQDGEALQVEQGAYSPGVTVDELNDMLDHSQPLSVRAAVARTPYPGVARTASHDPSPLVRALALDGWDLPEGDRKRLESDDQVSQLLRALQQ